MMFRRRRYFYGWVIVVVLGVISIIVQGTANFLFGLVLIPIQKDLGSSRALISTAYSVSLVIWGVAGIPAGRLVDRSGARLMMAAGSVLAGTSLLGLALAHSVWQLYLCWGAGIGLAVALSSQQVVYTVVANWFEARIGAAFAVVTALAALSSPVYLPAFGWLVVHTGWRKSLVFAALLFIVVCLPLSALVLRRRPEDIGLSRDGRLTGRPLRTAAVTGFPLKVALRRTAFWTLSFSQVGATLPWAAITAHQIPFLIGRSFDPVVAATALGAVGLISIPGRVVLNLAGDRLGPQRLLALSIGLQGSGQLILLLTTNLVWLLAYVLVFGIAFGSASGLRAALIAEQFGRRSFGAISAVTGLMTYAFAALGPALAGLVYDRTGGYELAFAVGVVLFGLAALSVVVTPPAPPEFESQHPMIAPTSEVPLSAKS